MNLMMLVATFAATVTTALVADTTAKESCTVVALAAIAGITTKMGLRILGEYLGLDLRDAPQASTLGTTIGIIFTLAFI